MSTNNSALTTNQKRRLKLEAKRKRREEKSQAEEEELAFLRELAEENAKATAPNQEIKNEPTNQNPNTSKAPKQDVEVKSAEPNKENILASTTAKDPSSPQQPPAITRKQVEEKADTLWADIKSYVEQYPNFKNKPDKEKLDFFRNKLGYNQFMEEFPIVSRYMICKGQFHMTAFKRYLDKCEKTQHPPPHQRAKGYMQEQWIMRQADYVAYLWETYQKRHFNMAERKWVWQQTFERLKNEFDDFQDMHKDIEAKVKEEKAELAAQNAVELIERVKTGLQTLTPDEEVFLLTHLEKIATKKLHSGVMSELKKKRGVYERCISGVGEGPDDKTKVSMIETVDVSRMNEIDDKYKPPELRGMEPILDEEIDPDGFEVYDEVIE